MKYKKKKGFTLVEFLIVTAIIGLMSVVVWINYLEFRKAFNLERSANQAAQGIRVALEKAMSVEVPDNGFGDEFKGGYGVFFETGKENFIIFSDTNNTGRYNINDDSIIKEIFFEEGIKIKEIEISGSPPCNNQPQFWSVVFLPPDPLVFVGGRVGINSRCNDIKIVLEHQDLEKEKTIMVNKAGLIELKHDN